MSRPHASADDTLAKRRSAMKGWLLGQAAIAVSDSPDFADARDVAEMLELPPGALENVAARLTDSLWRQSERHPLPAPKGGAE